MSAAPSPKTIDIGLAGITVLPDRVRQLRPEVVAELVESIKAQGQVLQPIVVRTKPRGGLGYILVSGWHRLMAVRELKLNSIRATVLEGISNDEALLAEIVENLVRAELTPMEQDLHVARRKKLYEKLHPETLPTKRGGPGRGKKRTQLHGATESAAAFIDDTAAKTGKHRVTVSRSAARGDALAKIANGQEAIGTSLDTPGEAHALIKLPAQEQRKLIKRAAAGNKVSAKSELKKIKRTQREKELGTKQLTMPTEKYGVIVTDDEWDFKVYSRETGMDRHAANHYPTAEGKDTAEKMHEHTKDRFKCAAKDCVLAMWTTVPHSAIAHKLMELRGFTYKSQVVWYKKRSGKGRGTRANGETQTARCTDGHAARNRR